MKIFNKALRILLITDGLILLAGAMLGPIYALFIEKVGGDLLDASFAFGVFALVASITTLISGRFSDKLKEKESILILGYFIMGMGFLGYILVNSIWSLLMVQVIIGLGEAIYAPAFDSIYTKHLCERKSGREWSAWEALQYLTTSVGAVIGGFIAANFGFETMFLVMSSLCFISIFYIFSLPKKVL